MNEMDSERGKLLYIRASFVDTSRVVYCLIDSGATVSFAHSRCLQDMTRMLDYAERFVVGIHGKQESTKGLGLGSLMVKPGQIIKGNFHIHASLPLDLIIGMDIIKRYFSSINLQSGEVIPYKGMPIKMQRPTAEIPSVMVASISNYRVDRIWATISNTIDISVSKTFREELRGIVNRWSEAFHIDGDILSPCKHTVPRLEFTEENFTVKSRGYRYSEGERLFLKETIAEWVEQGICKPTSSEYSSPCVIVSKGHKQGGLVKPRLCIDYRALNRYVKECRWPIANSEYLLSKLEGSSYYAQIDLAKGFLQCRVREEDQKYLAFISPSGLYTFTRTPFGLKTSANAFMYCLDSTLNGVQNTLIYMDDCVAFGKTEQECLQAFESLMKALHKDGWQVAVNKCVLGARRIKVLGHIVSEEGVEVDGEKVKSITEFKRPENVSQVRSFLGICSYYRKYIFLFSKLAKPLTYLLQKGIDFTWNEKQQEAFEELKKALVTAPILRHFYPDLPTVIHCDSSDFGCGGALMQVEGGKERVVAYCSRSFSVSEQKLAAIEREFLGLLFCLERFRCYVYLRPFKVVCDSDPLTSLRYATDKNPKLLRWAMRLREFNYEMIFRPSGANKVADGLSRIVPRETEIDKRQEMSMPMDMEAELPSIIAFLGVSEVDWESMQKQDEECNKIREEVQRGKEMPFKVVEDLVYHMGQKGRQLYVPKAWRRKVLNLHHDHVLAGHMGIKGTMKKIKENMWWPRMKQDVFKYVQSCDACQRAKRPIRKQPGLLRPIVPPGSPGEYLAWDITGPLPTTSVGNSYIIMSICLLSKFVIARPITDGSAESVVRFFLENIVSTFGSPKYILSDCGASFLSAKTKAVLQSVGCKGLKTSAYAPSTNGIIEKQFFLLKQCLRIYLQDTPQSRWDQYLSYLIFAMNTTEKPSTGFTPYELVFIKKPPRPLIPNIFGDAEILAPKHQAQMMRKQAAEAIQRAQAAYKIRADKSREDLQFNEGDLVLIFNPSTPIGMNRKLTVHWKGPWMVVRMVTANTVLISSIEQSSPSKIINVRRVKPYYTRVEEEAVKELELEAERRHEQCRRRELETEDSEYESAEDGEENSRGQEEEGAQDEEKEKKEQDLDTEGEEKGEGEIIFSEHASGSSSSDAEEVPGNQPHPGTPGELFRSRSGRPLRPPDRYKS